MIPAPGRAARGQGLWLLLAWITGSALLLGIARGAIARFETIDPDDQLRLQQVRDWLAGQSWFDVGQYRIDPPAGTAMHWSRLVDVPIALVLRIAGRFTDPATAETVALVAVPLLTFGCALLLVAAITRRLFGADVPARIAAFLLAINAGVLLQMRPMRIDHHGWQIVCGLGIVLGLAGRRDPRSAAGAGLAAALLLNISIEGLPFVALAGLLVAVRWLLSPMERRWQLAAYIGGLAAGSLLLFVAVHGGLTPLTFCDAVSPIHLAVFAVAAAGTALAAWQADRGLAVRVGLLAATGAGCAVLYALAAPMCLAGPFAQLDPLVHRTWYLRVREGLPIWAQSRTTAVLMIGYPLIGLAGAIHMARTDAADRRAGWTDYAVLLAATIVIALLVQRANAIANVLAVPGGVALMLGLIGRIGRLTLLPVRASLTAFAVLALLPATPAVVATIVVPGRATPTPSPSQEDDARCDAPERLGTLRGLPTGRILAPLDISASLILHTPHAVLATGHHRNRTGMRDAIRFFTGTEADARRIVATHGIDYVALCPTWSEIAIYRRTAPAGMAARLASGRAPGWLRPIAAGDGPMLWRVVR